MDISLSLRFNGHFSRWTCVSHYQNVSIPDIIGAKDDGGGSDNWSYKDEAKLFLQAGYPLGRPTNSVGAPTGTQRASV